MQQVDLALGKQILDLCDDIVEGRNTLCNNGFYKRLAETLRQKDVETLHSETRMIGGRELLYLIRLFYEGRASKAHTHNFRDILAQPMKTNDDHGLYEFDRRVRFIMHKLTNFGGPHRTRLINRTLRGPDKEAPWNDG